MKEVYGRIIIIVVGLCIGLTVWLGINATNKYDICNTDNYEMVEFAHKNHDYIFVQIGVGRERIGGLVYDPDCRFCND